LEVNLRLPMNRDIPESFQAPAASCPDTFNAFFGPLNQLPQRSIERRIKMSYQFPSKIKRQIIR
jgi:hypothetical protein